MSNETYQYLDLIGEHLQEGHASVIIGAGFSRNAIKVDERLKSSPDWGELAQIFIDKLASGSQEKDHLRHLSPLVLAERVEAIYGRPELDRLLLSSIRDADFLPSSLHYKLLRLPWSDIFTTNYDTLLERTSEELTEQQFTFVTCKEDLVGSSGTTRIIKLHGSFPSQRPFIITSEDYRTYPQVFAPFVNTVQQSMLENTLCLIGFSGDDPNFEKWVGWIQDNLGYENSPNIYLLIHYELSEAEKRLLSRRKIIPVDLSKMTENKNVSAIYEAMLDYLTTKQLVAAPDEWNLHRIFSDNVGKPIPIQEALSILHDIHHTYPGWLTVPEDRLGMLRSVTRNAITVLNAIVESSSPFDLELEYLYEYDWLREKTLLPPFTHELKCYHKILERHPESSFYKYAIQMSLLRDLRECGQWEEWGELYDKLQKAELFLTVEQIHHLHWEGCLCAQAQYQFQALKQQLDTWNVNSNMPVWVLRKAGILAEYGAHGEAHGLLQRAILDVRRRLAHQHKTDLTLLSLESAMMFLQGYISDALNLRRKTESSGIESSDTIADRRHHALHAQHHVSWEMQNSAFLAQLEAPWMLYNSKQEQPSFDFGRVHKSSHFGEDKEVIRAYAFLRFREETGIPFFINSIYNGTKAACGAAERIARYSPLWSILTLVRADEPKSVEQTITRSILSDWTQEEADRHSLFCIEALLSTETELPNENWFYRGSFAHLVAEVLPEVLSELCAKCSYSVLAQILSLTKQLYASDKRYCYPQIKSLIKRLIYSYPKRRELIEQFLSFPIIEGGQPHLNLPDPISMVPIEDLQSNMEPERDIPTIEQAFKQLESATDKKPILDRLLHCLCHGMLTKEEKMILRDELWSKDGCFNATGWIRTICLELPPPDNIDVSQYLVQAITKEAFSYGQKKSWSPSDLYLLREIRIVLTQDPNTFLSEQITDILQGCADRLRFLSRNILEQFNLMGTQESFKQEMYEIAQTLWFLIHSQKGGTVTDQNLQCMRSILETYQQTSIHHCGLSYAWSRLLSHDIDMGTEFSDCFRATDELCVRWGFETLAAGLLHPDMNLMEDSEICVGMELLAQQIVWGVPKLLTFALQAAKIAVEHRPELVSSNLLEPIITGLERLEQQTRITADDTVEVACNKGDIRVNAAILARTLHTSKMYGSRPDVVKKWLIVMNDENEFAEIRNALHSSERQ